jgi:hypothetical protein
MGLLNLLPAFPEALAKLYEPRLARGILYKLLKLQHLQKDFSLGPGYDLRCIGRWTLYPAHLTSLGNIRTRIKFMAATFYSIKIF